MTANELRAELKRRGAEIEHPNDREVFIKYNIACVEKNEDPQIRMIWPERIESDGRVEELEIASEWIMDTVRVYRG